MRNSQYIRLTKASISEMFDECNHLYFNDSVDRPIKFEVWTPHKKVVGMVRPVWSSRHKRINATLHISRRYRWTKDNLRKVMVHEMIHLYIGDYKEPLTFLQRLPLIGHLFINQHGDHFITLMNELNEKYNLGISVKAKQMREEFIK